MPPGRAEGVQSSQSCFAPSGVAFVIILLGIGLMLAGLVTVGVVTTASIMPQAGTLLLFNKDKELRRTIEAYHGHILASQKVLTLFDLAETIGQISAKDAIRERIILTVLKVT